MELEERSERLCHRISTAESGTNQEIWGQQRPEIQYSPQLPFAKMRNPFIQSYSIYCFIDERLALSTRCSRMNTNSSSPMTILVHQELKVPSKLMMV